MSERIILGTKTTAICYHFTFQTDEMPSILCQAHQAQTAFTQDIIIPQQSSLMHEKSTTMGCNITTSNRHPYNLQLVHTTSHKLVGYSINLAGRPRTCTLSSSQQPLLVPPDDARAVNQL